MKTEGNIVNNSLTQVSAKRSWSTEKDADLFSRMLIRQLSEEGGKVGAAEPGYRAQVCNHILYESSEQTKSQRKEEK